VWFVKVLQDPRHENPTETVGIFGPYVGCGPTSISCGCSCDFLGHRRNLLLDRAIPSWGASHLNKRLRWWFAMSEYIRHYCETEAERCKGKLAIIGVLDLKLRTILFTIARMAGECFSTHGSIEILKLHHGMHITSCVQLVRWTPP
jgi:hypothetical protein